MNDIDDSGLTTLKKMKKRPMASGQCHHHCLCVSPQYTTFPMCLFLQTIYGQITRHALIDARK